MPIMAFFPILGIGIMTIGAEKEFLKPSLRPVDQYATLETYHLHWELKELVKKGVMFGHQDDTAYGVGWNNVPGGSDVKSVCGDYPAVYGWELGDLELGHPINLDSVPFAKIRKEVEAAHSRGGINTISWHLNNPLTGGNAWDNKTTEAVKSILPEGKEHEKFKEWLDRVANFLLSLRDKDGTPIPVVFRPWHEELGDWFWWGKGHATPREYIEIYRFTVDYLREVKGVHNLIYAWSPSEFNSEKEYLETYPGDEYVDIMGVDCYRKDPAYQTDADKMLNILEKVAANHHKIMAFTETGYEGIQDPAYWTKQLLPLLKGRPVSYVLVWRNAYNKKGHYFAPYPGSSSVKDFNLFKKSGIMIFEKEIRKKLKIEN